MADIWLGIDHTAWLHGVRRHPAWPIYFSIHLDLESISSDRMEGQTTPTARMEQSYHKNYYEYSIVAAKLQYCYVR